MFSFCENTWAGSETPWHIRKLTTNGRKLTGGADSVALCGRFVYWDLDIEITEHHLTHCCQKCRKEYVLTRPKGEI